MDNYTQYRFDSVKTNNPSKEEEKRKIKKTSNLVGAVFIVLWLLPSILNGIIVDVAKLIGLDRALSGIFSDAAFLMVFQTVISILLFTLPFLIIPIGLGKRVTSLALLKAPENKLFTSLVLVGVGASAFANAAANSIASFFEGFGIHFASPDIQYPDGIFGFFLSFIAIAVTPALVEEFANRGMVLGATREFGEGFALVVSAVFFSFMHGNLVQIPFAFIMGLVIGFAVIKTNSILTGMVIHFINNAISVAMSYLLEGIESVILESVISMAYFGVCTVLFFIGIFLAQKRSDKVWSLEKSESTLSFGEKFKYCIFSPTVIIAIGLTLIDCISTITFG